MAEEEEIKVLVTGFAPWKSYTHNPSQEIVSLLPSSLPSHPPIRLLKPPSAIPVSYHTVLSTVPALLKEHRPEIVLYIGRDEGRSFFGIERGAERDGYHQNLDSDRRVFTKAESKSAWGKSAARLETGIDLDDVCVRWQGGVKGVGKGRKGGKGVAIMVSDDVGDFVCGFIYYASLEAMERGEGRRDVVFLHVPMLEGKEEIEIGVKVVEALVKALAASWYEGRS